jgi:hypothetical protein
MGKSLIVNKLGTKNKWVFVPATDVAAKAFADAILDGEYKIYSLETSTGTDTATTAQKATVFGFNPVTGERDTISFVVPASTKETTIQTALLGKTFNTVKYDSVSVKLYPISKGV